MFGIGAYDKNCDCWRDRPDRHSPRGRALQAHCCLRVIARDMDKLARLFPDVAVEKRPADILDADATLRAIEGCDLVYDCVGLPGDQMHLHPVTARASRNAPLPSGPTEHFVVACVRLRCPFSP